ncbi:hypoxanthine-guanine phosphoribosyltransferase [Pseudomonadota bacterium]
MLEYLEESKQVLEEADLLCDQQEVDAAFDKMAADIANQIGDTNPLVLCVMTGAVVPAGILLPRLNFPLTIDYIHATRYGHRTEGGELDWIVKPSKPLKDRVVLLIDDILDEGLTLEAIIHDCKTAGAKEVYSAVLVEKIRQRPIDVKADFVGLEVEDRYLFGYGMDYKGYLRNAPGIYAVKGL